MEVPLESAMQSNDSQEDTGVSDMLVARAAGTRGGGGGGTLEPIRLPFHVAFLRLTFTSTNPPTARGGNRGRE